MCTNPYLTYEINGKAISLQELKKKNIKENFYKYGNQNKIVVIKCGKCKECLNEKKMNMYYKIKKEIELNKNNIFITLTYDNENFKDLNKKDIQDFLKR